MPEQSVNKNMELNFKLLVFLGHCFIINTSTVSAVFPKAMF